MNIRDLVGLEKPITKFIEVISSGMGNITKSTFTRKITNAKIEEIQKISQALQSSNVPIKYEDGKITAQNFTDVKNELKIVESEQDILLRATSREKYKSIKKQNNIENITSAALLEYMDDEHLDNNFTDKKPSEDWINRFFDYAEDIGTEEMQSLWSKVLAGEIKKPNSYSLRTLEFLRNTSLEEAKAFEKIASFIIIGEHDHLPKLNDKFYEEKEIIYQNFLDCKEYGFLQQVDMLAITYFINESIEYYEIDNNILQLKCNGANQKYNYPVYGVTKVGKEILSLMNIQYTDDFIQEIINHFKNNGILVEKLDKV